MNSVENKALAPFPNLGTDSQLMRTTGFAGAAAGSEPGGGMSLGTILQALRRRWPLAISAGLVAGALGVAAMLLLFPAPYTASGVVQLLRPPVPYLGHDVGQVEDPSIFKMTMAARVKSPMVLMAALKDADLAGVRSNPNAVKWLESALKTDFLIGPEIMKLSLSGEDPHEVAAVINRVIDAFIEESRQEELGRHGRNMDALEASRKKSENELYTKKFQLKQEEDKRGFPDLVTIVKRYNDASSVVLALQSSLTPARIEVVYAEQDLKRLVELEKAIEKVEVPESYFNKELQETIDGKELLLKRANAKAHLDKAGPATSSKYEDELKDIDNRLKAMQKERSILKRYQDELRQQNTAAQEYVRSNISKAKTKLILLEEELLKAQAVETNLNPKLMRLPFPIEVLRDEVLRSEAVVTKLGETIALLRAEPAPGPRVKEWSRAEPPDGRDYNRQIKFGAAGGVGLFLCAVVGVCFLELRAGRISMSDEVVQGLGMPVVGTLPPVPARARSLTDARESSVWQSRLLEAVDSVRSYVLHVARADNVHTVMVTSAGVGEGKTSLASQLAASLARAWKKTLLIDGDLRHPATHTLFNVAQEPGFAEVLRGEAELAEAIKPTSLSRLWLMPAGHCDAHAVQALAQDNVRTMLESLKQQYDFIIVDSCPILPVADSLSLGQHVDGVLYAVLRDVSRVPALKAAQSRLDNLGVRSLGAVLIGTCSDVGNAGSRYGMLEGSLK